MWRRIERLTPGQSSRPMVRQRRTPCCHSWASVTRACNRSGSPVKYFCHPWTTVYPCGCCPSVSVLALPASCRLHSAWARRDGASQPHWRSFLGRSGLIGRRPICATMWAFWMWEPRLWLSWFGFNIHKRGDSPKSSAASSVLDSEPLCLLWWSESSRAPSARSWGKIMGRYFYHLLGKYTHNCVLFYLWVLYIGVGILCLRAFNPLPYGDTNIHTKKQIHAWTSVSSTS